ncbi:MAG: polymer-forming cytoskeletal protein [Gammaproteobacteria bacterium]|nr:polymer-forming cytoskeletal protein [Gammaproteobacteria bacterium]
MGTAAGHTISIIAQGTTVHGNLEAAGHILVEGTVEGSSSVRGLLTVAEAGIVNGDVHADVVIIKGRVNGNITARERLELHESAVIVGDVLATTLVIRSGAVINGTSRMQAPQKSLRALPRPDRILGGALRRLAASA